MSWGAFYLFVWPTGVPFQDGMLPPGSSRTKFQFEPRVSETLKTWKENQQQLRGHPKQRQYQQAHNVEDVPRKQQQQVRIQTRIFLTGNRY